MMRLTLLSIIALSLSAAGFAQSSAAPASPKKMASTAGPVATSMKNFKMSGSPSAPITLEIYTDYECPSCRMFFKEVLPQLESQYVATGKLQILHRDFRLPQHQYSKLAARYANAAGQIGQYNLVAKQLFDTQPDWSQNGNVDGTVAKVLPPGDMQKVRELVKTDSHLDDTATADEAMGNKDGLNQTPTLVIVSKGKRQKIDGFVQFNILKLYIDQMLAKG
jgi:protein-disulfide isomerase